MEATILYYFYIDHGKENGNYYSILGLFGENGNMEARISSEQSCTENEKLSAMHSK